MSERDYQASRDLSGHKTTAVGLAIALALLLPSASQGQKNPSGQGQKGPVQTQKTPAATTQKAPSSPSTKSPTEKAPLPAAGKAKTIKGSVLKQVTDWRGGMRLELCKLGGRFVTSDIIILLLPDKRAFFINNHTKTYANVDKKFWQKQMGVVSTEPGPEVVTKLPDEVYCGLKTKHYRIVKYAAPRVLTFDKNGRPILGKDPSVKTQTVTKTSNAQLSKNDKLRFLYCQHVWATSDFDMSKEFLSECANIFMMPGDFGLPLKFMRSHRDCGLEQKKNWTTFIDTLKCDKNVDLDPENFKLPTGYRLVKRDLDVMMGDDLEDLED